MNHVHIPRFSYCGWACTLERRIKDEPQKIENEPQAFPSSLLIGLHKNAQHLKQIVLIWKNKHVWSDFEYTLHRLQNLSNHALIISSATQRELPVTRAAQPSVPPHYLRCLATRSCYDIQAFSRIPWTPRAKKTPRLHYTQKNVSDDVTKIRCLRACLDPEELNGVYVQQSPLLNIKKS